MHSKITASAGEGTLCFIFLYIGNVNRRAAKYVTHVAVDLSMPNSNTNASYISRIRS